METMATVAAMMPAGNRRPLRGTSDPVALHGRALALARNGARENGLHPA